MEVAPVPTAVSQPAPMIEIIHGAYRCLPCVAICNTRQMLDNHLVGKKHVAKIALCGGEVNFQSIADLPELQTENLTPAGKKRKNASAQGHFRCELCEIDFPSAFPFESHMQGKRHLNKVQKKELGDAPSGIPCEICSISCPSKEAYDSHVNGKKHLAKVAAMGANGGSGDTQPIAAFYCTDCDVSTTSAEILEMHKQGKKHQAKVAKAAGGSTAGEVFQCEFCQVEVMGKDNFDAHRNGKKHAEKVRKIAEGASGEEKKPVRCDTCDITMPAQEHLDMHLKGKKHLKKIESANKPPAETFKCDPCGVAVNAQVLLEKHIAGKKHLKTVSGENKEAAPEDLACDVCKVSVTSQALMDSHMQGKRHLKATGALPSGNDSSMSSSPKKAKYDPAALFCQLCGVQSNSPQMLETHLAGKAHGKKVIAANQENASAMATSLIQSVREETKDVEMTNPAPAPSPTKDKKPLEVQPQQPQQPPVIANVAATPQVASPGRASRARRAN